MARDYEISLKSDRYTTKTLATINTSDVKSIYSLYEDVVDGLHFVQATVEKLAESQRQQRTYTGYITREEFDSLNVSTVPIPANFAGLEAVDVPTRLQEQLFRIYEVEESEDYVTVHARHVWYDNLQNYTLWEPTEDTNYTAAAVCRNILTNTVSPVDSNVASDCTDTKPGSEFDYARKNIVECFLDPENGVCAKFGLSLIRYNWDFFCLKEVGYDRGYVIQDKKNLLGVVRTESIENVATRVAPIGMDKEGNVVWLNNNGSKYVDSQYINDYAYPRVEIYETGLRIGQDDVTADNINDKLLTAGQNRFDVDHVDLPEVTMTINFLSIGDTEEYSQYRGLDKVYLYDIVTIKDTTRGYEYSAQVVAVEHDILTGMLTSVTLGKINNSDGVRKIATWQVPEVSGENIRLKTIMAGAFQPGAINGDDIATGAVGWVHLNAASIDQLTTEQLEALTANIHDLIAGTITADDITAGSITSDKIGAGEIKAINIDAQAITSEKIDAGAITSDKIDANAVTANKIASDAVTAGAIAAGAVTAGKIAADAVTAETIQSGAIATDKLAAGAVVADKIGAGAVTTAKLDAYAVTAEKLAAGAVDADKIAAGSISADLIDATDINAINAKLGTAAIASAQIASADISYAKVKDLTAGTAIFDTTITDQGVADRLYINRLLITYGQMVSATIGDLVIGATDGKYYHVDVAWVDGVPSLVPTQVQTPSAEEIEAGHTVGGKTIIGDVGTYADLSTADFYAINSILDIITAKRIDVDELWARDAFIDRLMVQDISSNTYIRSTIGNWTGSSTITQTINSLNSKISELGYGTVYMQPDEPDHSHLSSGDVWIQTISDTTWQQIYNNQEDYPTWQAIYNDVSTWQVLGAIPKMWVWDGRHWQQMYDALLPTRLETEIEQLSDAITLRATKEEVDLLSGEVTEFNSRLTIQAQEIESAVSAVNAKAASYIMWADPQTAYTVSLGDIWVKRDPGFCDTSTWQSMLDGFTSWDALKTMHDAWGDMLGDRTFVWNGTAWVETGDRASEIIQETRINQTTTEISLLAETSARLGDELIATRAQLSVTNNAIISEVSRATSAEDELSTQASRIEQKADNITLGVTPAGALKTVGSYISISGDSIVLATGGKLIASADQIQIGTGTLESALAKKGDVTNSIQQFYLSTSNTTLSGGSWADTAPAWTNGKFMWMRTKVTHADGSTTYMPSTGGVCIAGATGASGAAGVGVRNITEHYLATSASSGVTKSTSGWTTSIQTMTATKKYLWNYESIAYTSGTTADTTPVIIGTYGDKGDKGDRGTNGTNGTNGQSVTSIETRYYLHTSYTNAPSAAWSNWSTTPPAYQAGKYYWTWTKSFLANGTEIGSVKVSELGVNAAYDRAADAEELAQAIIDGSQTAMYSSNISNTGVFIDDETLHVTAQGNMYVDSGGALIIRSSASTEQNPQNTLVMNASGITMQAAGNITIKSNSSTNAVKLDKNGISIETGGTLKCSADKLVLGTSGGSNITLSSRLDSISLSVEEAATNIAPAYDNTRIQQKGEIVSYKGKIYRFKEAFPKGYTFPYDKVDEITDTEYTKDYVADNAYVIRSGIDIKAAGIEITGGKYIKIKAGSTEKLTLDANGIIMDTAGKFKLTAKDGDNSSIMFGTSQANATFSVGDAGNVRCHDLQVTGNLTVDGSGLPRIVVSQSEPSDGSNVIWLQPTSGALKNINYRPDHLTMDEPGGLGYYRDFEIPYTAQEYVSGDSLYYGIRARLQFYNMSGYANHSFRARIWNGQNYEILATETLTVGQWATITIDHMDTTARAIPLSSTGGSIWIRLETTAPGSVAMLLNEDMVIKYRNTSSGAFSACTVRYKQ